jgi:hypothetical protein
MLASALNHAGRSDRVLAVKTRVMLLLVLAAALAAVPSVASGDTARVAANTTTFPDSIGEDVNAPDITSVVVSNDDAGLITFQINIPNRPALTQDMFVLIFIDSDNNSATGDVGAEYAIDLEPGQVGLFQWNGATYVQAQAQTSLTYSYSNGATIHISANDLGKTKAFAFAVAAFSGFAVDANGNPDDSNLKRDSAPDPGHGLFTYQVLTKLVLSVTAFTIAPRPAKAGRLFSVSMAVNENDTNGPVTAATVGCAASIAGKRLVATTHALRNGIAVCVWRLPATAKGRFVRGLITVTVRGTTLTRGFSARAT